jgi:superfamily II DNA or RNA helicase
MTYSGSDLSRLVVRLEVNLKTAQNRAFRSPGHFARTRLSAVQIVAREVLAHVGHENDFEESLARVRRVLATTVEMMLGNPSLDSANYEGRYKFDSRRDSLVDEIFFEAKVSRLHIDVTTRESSPGPDSSRDESEGTKGGDASAESASEHPEFDFGRNEFGLAAPPMRRWQLEAIGAWERRNRHGVVEAVTGTGKSLVGLAAIASVVRLGGSALVIVPTSALLEQWVRDIERRLPDVSVGRLTGGKADDFRDHDVLVATVQTASKHQPSPRSLALLVGDEVHRYGAKTFARALNDAYGWRLGLTATYERQGDTGIEDHLDPYFGGSLFEYGYGQALADGVVAPFELATIGVKFSAVERDKYDEAEERCWKTKLKLVKDFNYRDDWLRFFEKVQAVSKENRFDVEARLCGRYISAFTAKRTVLAEASAKEDFIYAVRESFTRPARSLVFTETKDSASRIAHGLNQAVIARPISSELKGAERELLLKRFSQGTIQVLCAPRILDEGIDVPEADFAMIVAASKSKRQMIQRMGRVIRLKPDGRNAKIALVYVEDTSEDPATGGHEAFLEEVIPFASQAFAFRANDLDRFGAWLAS